MLDNNEIMQLQIDEEALRGETNAFARVVWHFILAVGWEQAAMIIALARNSEIETGTSPTFRKGSKRAYDQCDTLVDRQRTADTPQKAIPASAGATT